MTNENQDIFGNIIERPNKEIGVNLYCDEIKSVRSPVTNDKWHYIGIFIVPVDFEKDLLIDLDKARYFKEYSSHNDLSKIDLNYYEQNNCKIHFVDLDARMYHVANRWHKYILHRDSSNKIHFSILGINESKLDISAFGGNDFITIYNRFFRTAVAYPLLKFFPGHKITVNDIFHEVGDQKNDDLFPLHSIFKINSEEKLPIYFKNQEIKFLEKDHGVNSRGNFIQLIDLILGATRVMFDGISNPKSSNGKFKNQITESFSELISRLVNNPDNPNSNYCLNYHKRMNLSFFPYNRIGLSSEYGDISKRMGEFYKRKGEMNFLNKHQQSLF